MTPAVGKQLAAKIALLVIEKTAVVTRNEGKRKRRLDISEFSEGGCP
jgi:hypothetical protein